jgi:hypothetical protein
LASSFEKVAAMKWRAVSVVVVLLYVAVAGCFGVVHDHHSATAQQHCAACAWLMNATADAPAPSVHVVTPLVTAAPAIPSVPAVVAPVFCATASRAPPLASA